MMDSLRQYFISITAVSLICSIVKCSSNGKTAGGAVIQLAAGLIMVLTVLSPLVEIRLDDLPICTDAWSEEAEQAAQTGEYLAREEMIVLINQRLETYILDKADVWGTALTVSFQNYGENMMPEQVVLRGKVSPYVKAQLQQSITSDLGIARENQIWIG